MGIQVHLLTIADLNEIIRDAIARKKRLIMAYHNLHSLYLFRRDPTFRAFYEKADYIHVDGMALVFLGRLFGVPLKRRHRVTYVDWVDLLISAAARNGWRVFYLGSKPDVATKGAEILRQRYPDLEIETAHGYFDETKAGTENLAVLEEINSYRPNVLLVGMGMPRQEHWVFENLSQIDANAILAAGAAMDYVAQAISTPPRWAGQVGLEWLFRLIDEPGRLWRRYMLEPLTLLGPIASELIRTRKLK